MWENEEEFEDFPKKSPTFHHYSMGNDSPIKGENPDVENRHLSILLSYFLKIFVFNSVSRISNPGPTDYSYF